MHADFLFLVLFKRPLEYFIVTGRYSNAVGAAKFMQMSVLVSFLALPTQHLDFRTKGEIPYTKSLISNQQS
jgi:hypothetical protein